MSEQIPSAALREPYDPNRFCDDVDRLSLLTTGWKGLDPTSIAEAVLEALLDMLDLEFVGLRFNDGPHIFRRFGAAMDVQDQQRLLAAISPWFENDPRALPERLAIGGAPLFAASVRLGEISEMGSIVVAARRAGFPGPTEILKARMAASQACLAIREVRELNDRAPPADMRAERPWGDALAEREWNLNLTINTIPAMAWSATTDGILDFCNQHFLDFVGLPADEMMGFGFYRIFHPEDTPHLLASWQEILVSKRSREVDGRIRRADGEFRWCTLRQNPLLDPDGNIIKWYGVVLDIEDRKRAEDGLKEAKAALLASEENLRLIIDSLPVLAWVARPEGGAEFVSQRWIEYAGAKAEDLLEWGFLDFYHPDDVARMAEIWRRDLETSDRTSLKGRIRRFDGEYRWFYFAGQKITDANGVVRWVGANVDIEDLQRAEDALKASEHRLKLIIDTIPAMAWSASPDGEVDFWSKNLLDFCGLRFEEVRGEGFYRIFHPDDLAAMRANWEMVRATRRGEEIDGRILRADGEYRWFTLRQNPLLDGNGNVAKWYGALIEIDDRKRAEEELRQSQSELARVSRMTTLGELAVSIAHEVNQPLMAIVTNAGTCLRWLDETQFNSGNAREAAQRIVQDGHRAGEIIASIRALASKSPARMEQMDLHEAIRDVLLVLNGEIRRRGIDARLNATRKPLVVRGDRTQLQQVLLNLIMNSVESMGEVEDGQRRVTISTAITREEFARVSVLDTGSGLSSDSGDRIFEAFFSTKPDGMGMGLSICRSIVETHGGSIQAFDNSPRGSVFSFTVPIAVKAEINEHAR